MSNGYWGLFWTAVTVAAVVAMMGCASAPALPDVPDVAITRANLATPVKCPVSVPGTPEWVNSTTARAAAPNVFEAAKLADAGLFQRDQHIKDLVDLLEACVK